VGVLCIRVRVDRDRAREMLKRIAKELADRDILNLRVSNLGLFREELDPVGYSLFRFGLAFRALEDESGASIKELLSEQGLEVSYAREGEPQLALVYSDRLNSLFVCLGGLVRSRSRDLEQLLSEAKSRGIGSLGALREVARMVIDSVGSEPCAAFMGIGTEVKGARLKPLEVSLPSGERALVTDGIVELGSGRAIALSTRLGVIAVSIEVHLDKCSRAMERGALESLVEQVVEFMHRKAMEHVESR